MITPAFSPKRMYDPSSRRVSFLVRTTTALTTSPFLTAQRRRRGRNRGLLDCGHDYVPDAGVAPLAPAEHADGQDAPGTRVVRDPEPRLLLYHYSALDMM